jgi:hypothetical protein
MKIRAFFQALSYLYLYCTEKTAGSCSIRIFYIIFRLIIADSYTFYSSQTIIKMIKTFSKKFISNISAHIFTYIV